MVFGLRPSGTKRSHSSQFQADDFVYLAEAEVAARLKSEQRQVLLHIEEGYRAIVQSPAPRTLFLIPTPAARAAFAPLQPASALPSPHRKSRERCPAMADAQRSESRPQ